jgi:Predicted membrane protein (DUF2306)
MSHFLRNLAALRKGRKLIWILTSILVTIGLLAAARRTYVLLGPPQEPRFAAAAAMDSGFAQHKALTVAHILPAALFMVLMPLQFIRRIRERHLAWHRWSGRLLVILGFVVGMSALVMSYTMAIGGANETAATTLVPSCSLFSSPSGFGTSVSTASPGTANG